jgi:hypothetical protein
MNTLFSLLLGITCLVSCYEAVTAEQTESYVLASSLMCLSAIIFLVHDKYPLFGKKRT